MEVKDLLAWFVALKDPSSWAWSHFAFLFGVVLAFLFLLMQIGFADWLLAQLQEMAKESEQRALQERRRSTKMRERREQEYQESRRSESSEEAALKADNYKQQIKRQDLGWMWKYFSDRQGSWSKHDWHLHECMDFWERAAFDKRRWTKKEGAREMKKYLRELERRERSSFSGLYDQCHQFPNLSREDIHQRIDFLETIDVEPEKKPPTIFGADDRAAFADDCYLEMEKELNAHCKRHGLDPQDQSQYTPQQLERVRRIKNRWEALIEDGPPQDLAIGEEKI